MHNVFELVLEQCRRVSMELISLKQGLYRQGEIIGTLREGRSRGLRQGSDTDARHCRGLGYGRTGLLTAGAVGLRHALR